MTISPERDPQAITKHDTANLRRRRAERRPDAKLAAVEIHRGMISARDMPGPDCVFTVGLPRAQMPEPALAGV